MCQAVPRKVVKIKERIAEVLVGKKLAPVTIVCNDVKIGDYLLVYGNIGLSKIGKEELKEYQIV